MSLEKIFEFREFTDRIIGLFKWCGVFSVFFKQPICWSCLICPKKNLMILQQLPWAKTSRLKARQVLHGMHFLPGWFYHWWFQFVCKPPIYNRHGWHSVWRHCIGGVRRRRLWDKSPPCWEDHLQHLIFYAGNWRFQCHCSSWCKCKFGLHDFYFLVLNERWPVGRLVM